MSSSKWRQVAWVWSLALILSALLAAAGQRWPRPLPIQPPAVLGLVLLPPLLLTLWVIAHWPLPAGDPGAGFRQGTESVPPEQERHG